MQKPVKITGSNIVVFCMLITILNILLITMQNVLHLLFKYIKIEKYHYFSNIKAVATIQGTRII